MIINHNMSAINANRVLGNKTVDLTKSMEKLSSGQRINRAADDASGLAVSEKMRSQIRGLNQAERNIQNGVSFIQTTEGYLQGIPRHSSPTERAFCSISQRNLFRRRPDANSGRSQSAH
jgi:flagellin-like hook-associated protein FlgL